MTPDQARAKVAARPFAYTPETSVLAENAAARKMLALAKQEGHKPKHKRDAPLSGAAHFIARAHYAQILQVLTCEMKTGEVREAMNDSFGSGTAPRNLSQALTDMQSKGMIQQLSESRRIAIWGPAE